MHGNANPGWPAVDLTEVPAKAFRPAREDESKKIIPLWSEATMKHEVIAVAVFSALGIAATQHVLCGPLGRAADLPHQCWQDGGHGQSVPCTEITERLTPSITIRILAGVQSCPTEESPAELDQHG